MRVVLRIPMPSSALARRMLAAVASAPDSNGAAAAPRELILQAAMLSDVGCRRETNEDQAIIVNPEDPAQRESKGLLALVADGMGGHAAGEQASRIAVETIQKSYYESAAAPREALAEAFRQANHEIQEVTRTTHGRRMGTTGTALVVIGRHAIYAHVGDSRLYLIRGKQIRQLTEDHSEIMQLVRKGEITEKEARNHPARNIILRALGAEPEVEVALSEEPIEVWPGDRFVLCSDGLHGQLKDGEIRRGALRGDPAAACQELVNLAKVHGGPDNITVIVVQAVAKNSVEAPDSAA